MKPVFILKALPSVALLGVTLLTLQPVQVYAQTACLQLPVNCRVTSAFGPRFNPITKNYSTEYHKGVDFGCPVGTSIVAADSGIVTHSAYSDTAGYWVIMRSRGSTKLEFKYMHGLQLGVPSNRMINKGQHILISGSSGRSSGPHLHFQMEIDSKAIDPMPKFCTKPPLKEGILQGAESDVLDVGSQPTPPGDGGGIAPAMGMDGSLHEILGDAIAARALNPDYMRQLSDLSMPRLFAEVSYMKAIRLKLQHERSQHRERMEATQAMIQLLRTEAALRSQLDAQRNAASRAGVEQRR